MASVVLMLLQILVAEGLHPFHDERVRKLMDFHVYLDISDEVKEAWKLQRDMQERGHSEESIKASIAARKPDFDAYIDPQKKYADVIIQVSARFQHDACQTDTSGRWICARSQPCQVTGMPSFCMLCTFFKYSGQVSGFLAPVCMPTFSCCRPGRRCTFGYMPFII